MKISCDVVLDLIPLVKDGVASEDSIIIVNEHIKACESCKTEFEAFQANNMEDISIKDEKLIFDIKRSIYLTQIAILIVGTIVGIALSNSLEMFYNFLIMPIIGAISLATFKNKWYWVPIGIFILSYLWQTIMDIVLGGFDRTALYSGLFLSVIYTGLVGLGIVITMLLKFAFKEER